MLQLYPEYPGEYIRDVLITREQILAKTAEIGKAIACDFAGKNPLLICILKGAGIFHADLVRQIEIPSALDYIAVASYGASTHTTGEVRLVKDLDCPVIQRHVIIVEDIVDTGLTLQYLRHVLESRGPASVSVCALLSKPARRAVDVKVDYIGFEIPDVFVVGYGLDYAERYRNLPDIGILKFVAADMHGAPL